MRLTALLCLPALGVLIACSSETGPAGPPGAKGDPGQPGSADGAPGPAGESVSSAALAVGDLNCPNGGSRFTVGAAITYACNGLPGDASPNLSDFTQTLGVNDVVTQGPQVDVRAFATLAAAATQATANNRALQITQRIDIAQDTDLSAVPGLEVIQGGGFNIADGAILALPSNFRAGLTQVFLGDTTRFTVTGLNTALPEWWGAKADCVWTAGLDLYSSGGTSGRTCTGTDSTNAISAAVSAVKTAGGTVLYDVGTYLASAVPWDSGVSHIGKGTKKTQVGGVDGTSGTVIKQIDGTNADFVTTPAANEWIESAKIKGIRFIGDRAGASTAGAGLVVRKRLGEDAVIEDSWFEYFPDAGISILRGGQPSIVKNVHLFKNGYGQTASSKNAGMYITRQATYPADLMQAMLFEAISGDSNGVGPYSALLYVKGGQESNANGAGLSFQTVKSEVGVANTQQNTFVFESAGGLPVSADNVQMITSGTPETTAGSVFKIYSGSTPRLKWSNVAADKGTGAGVANILEDEVNSVTYANGSSAYLSGFYGHTPVMESGIRFENSTLSAGASVLDYYKESSFTPTLTFGGGAVGMDGTFAGRSTRIGNSAFFTVFITLSAKGSATGTAFVGNLPYTSGSLPASAAVRVNGMASGVGDTQVQSLINASATTIQLSKIAAGNAANLTDSDFTDVSSIIISGHYEVAP